MHPLWQIKQIVDVNGEKRVDRFLCFGSRGSPDIWNTFESLVIWIAIHKYGILGLLNYMDDAHGLDPARILAFYAKYGRYMPPKQAALLGLWDDLGIPHSDEKQVFGRQLTIIGFHVDSEAMTITLPDAQRRDLVANIRAFLDDTDRRRHTLREWQRLLGWINWGLNIQPLLRPALQSSYEKIKHRARPLAPIYLNREVRRDLSWIADRFEAHSGVYMLRASAWGPNDASIAIFCDASLSGLGFWCPSLSRGFYADLPSAPPNLSDNIFWFEAITVLAALHWVASHPTLATSPLIRLAIYTDNLNTVQIFDRLRAESFFTHILLAAVSILIDHPNIDLRVWHVPGERNVVADALSRHLLSVVRQYAPKLVVNTFTPPRWSPQGAISL